MRGIFFRSVLPSMLAFAFSGLYTIVDGFFIGRSLGDVGLAAINLAFPLAALLQALGTGIGMGGAVRGALCKGRGDEAGERLCLGNTLAVLLGTGFGAMAVLLAAGPWLLELLGAQGALLRQGCVYLRVIGLGAVFQLCATGLTPLLRNRDGALAAMRAMITGFVTNIAGDALLVGVLPFGMAGAAWATVLGQAVTLALCVSFLVRGGLPGAACFRPRVRIVLPLLVVGVSPFGLAMSPMVAIVLMNRAAIRWGGGTAVAAYAVIAYVLGVVLLLLQGVGDGSQPLMSRYLGQGEADKARNVLRMAVGLSVAVAAVSCIVLLLLRGVLAAVFGASGAVAAAAAAGFVPILLGLLPAAACRSITAYFYATGKNSRAYALVYGEPVLLGFALAILPFHFGMAGVWLATPLAQGLLFGLSLLLLKNKSAAGPAACLWLSRQE